MAGFAHICRCSTLPAGKPWIPGVSGSESSSARQPGLETPPLSSSVPVNPGASERVQPVNAIASCCGGATNTDRVSAKAELAPTYSIVTRPFAGTTKSNAAADVLSEPRIKPREAQV